MTLKITSKRQPAKLRQVSSASPPPAGMRYWEISDSIGRRNRFTISDTAALDEVLQRVLCMPVRFDLVEVDGVVYRLAYVPDLE